jgi:hypothetical protein
MQACCSSFPYNLGRCSTTGEGAGNGGTIRLNDLTHGETDKGLSLTMLVMIHMIAVTGGGVRRNAVFLCTPRSQRP